MAHIQRLILAALLFAASSVLAATTPKSTVYWIEAVQYSFVSGKMPTKQQACDALAAKISGVAGVTLTGVVSAGGCAIVHAPTGSPYGAWPINEGGGCPEGTVEQGDQCVSDDPPPTADEFCSQQSFTWNAWSTTQSRTGIVEDARELPMDAPSTVCMPVNGGGAGSPPGCKHKFTPQLRYRMGDSDPWRYEGDSWAYGPNDIAEAGGTLACVPGLDNLPEREDPKPGCEGGIPGQVNGVDVCIDPASGRTEGVDWTRVTDADGNVKEQRTNITCNGEKCTVVTTTKTPGEQGPGNTTTTTTTRGAYCAKNPESSICAGAVDPTGSTRNQNGRGGAGDPAGTGGGGGNGEGNGFCKENPDLPICKQGSFGGSCAASFTCDGDVIQCAMAKEQHIRNCQLFDDQSDESRLYDAEKAKDPSRNVTDDLPGNETIDLSNRINTGSVFGGGGASCLNDRSVTVWGTSVTLPFSAICQHLAMFGQLLLAVSFLLAARIVTRG